MSWLRLVWSDVTGRSRLAVVLGGGATLGAFEVGVIGALAERGVRPDLLVGTSVGAINAAFWGFDPSPTMGRRLLAFWLRAHNSLFFPEGPVPMVGRLVQGKDHLTTQSALAAMLTHALPGGARFEDASIPLAFTATEVGRGERVVIRTGPVLPAVLASSAIPALFPPVEIDGTRLADGGMVANCDIETAVAAGMTDVLVVDVMGDGVGTSPRNFWATAEDALGVMARRQTELALRLFQDRARIALIRPRLAQRGRVLDFGRTADLYADGYAVGDRFFAEGLVGRRVRPGLFEAGAERVPSVAAGRQRPVAHSTG